MKQEPRYDFYPKFLFRSPSLSFQKGKSTENDLLELSKSTFFKEAIYLASPILHDELLKWHQGVLTDKKEISKLKHSLYKYYTRMQSRSTPYGLFAACSTGEWGQKSEIITRSAIKRHTRLDMNYLCSLIQDLNRKPAIRNLLKFYNNNSLYTIGASVRYVEYNYVNNKRVHQISSVINNEYLQLVLEKAKNGALLSELAEAIVDKDISKEEAIEFIEELVENQLLVSELEPAVTGDELVLQVIRLLKKVSVNEQNNEIENVISILEETQKNISNYKKTPRQWDAWVLDIKMRA